jgi:hypothetical protein
VHVLHHEQHGGVLTQELEQSQQRLEDSYLLHRRLSGGLAGSGYHRRQVRQLARTQGCQRRVVGAHQRAECRDQRGVGQLTLAQLNAVAGQHQRAGLSCA